MSWRVFAIGGVLVVSALLALMAHPGLAEFASVHERRRSLRDLQLFAGQFPLAVGVVAGCLLTKSSAASFESRDGFYRLAGLTVFLVLVLLSGRDVEPLLRGALLVLGSAAYCLPLGRSRWAGGARGCFRTA